MTETVEAATGRKRPAAEDVASPKVKQTKYSEQKKDLSSAFGTRKARKIQNSKDSNIINMENMGDVMGSLVESINEAAKSVPSQETVQAKQDELRPVPKYDISAETPEDIYKLADIILPAELDGMKSQISAIKKSTDDASWKALLGYKNSTYLNERLARTLDNHDGSKPDTKRIKIIYFASLLISLYIHRRYISDREKLAARLANPPLSVLESLLSRFTTNNTMDNRNTDRVLTHLFVLSLHLDNFATDIRPLQEDLQLRPPQVVTLFKELGCTVKPYSETQRLAAGLTKSDAKHLKRAVLKTPLTFPKLKLGGKK